MSFSVAHLLFQISAATHLHCARVLILVRILVCLWALLPLLAMKGGRASPRNAACEDRQAHELPLGPCWRPRGGAVQLEGRGSSVAVVVVVPLSILRRNVRWHLLDKRFRAWTVGGQVSNQGVQWWACRVVNLFRAATRWSGTFR